MSIPIERSKFAFHIRDRGRIIGRTFVIGVVFVNRRRDELRFEEIGFVEEKDHGGLREPSVGMLLSTIAGVQGR